MSSGIDEENAQIDRLLGELSDREKQLVREAAVMGYFQGQEWPRGVFMPRDSVVLQRVIEACRAWSDLYPAIGSLAEVDTEADR